MHHFTFFRVLCLWPAICCSPALFSALHADEPPVDFNRDIRPILGDNCLHCHGPEADQRRGVLRVDERYSAMNVV